MNTNILATISAAFITDMAHKYSIPELLTARRVVSGDHDAITRRYGAGVVHASTEAQPTGQLSSIVRKLSVAVVVYADPDVKNLYHGSIELSYEHHQGGTNGKTTNFYISVESRIGQEVSYLGAIEKSAYDAIRSHLYYHEQDQKKSNDS
jgi:hypothetical protein